jgi:hypothetical protein
MAMVCDQKRRALWLWETKDAVILSKKVQDLQEQQQQQQKAHISEYDI